MHTDGRTDAGSGLAFHVLDIIIKLLHHDTKTHIHTGLCLSRHRFDIPFDLSGVGGRCIHDERETTERCSRRNACEKLVARRLAQYLYEGGGLTYFDINLVIVKATNREAASKLAASNREAASVRGFGRRYF